MPVLSIKIQFFLIIIQNWKWVCMKHHFRRKIMTVITARGNSTPFTVFQSTGAVSLLLFVAAKWIFPLYNLIMYFLLRNISFFQFLSTPLHFLLCITVAHKLFEKIIRQHLFLYILFKLIRFKCHKCFNSFATSQRASCTGRVKSLIFPTSIFKNIYI